MSVELFQKALQVRRGRANPYTFFYRNMSQFVFNRIMNNQNGIIQTRLKDNSGDPYCLINGQLDGIFFCANVDNLTMQPKEPSPYGHRRILIPADYFLDQDVNLYFADFYCLKRNGPHNVVLIMTRNGSRHDRFCRRNKLIQLDMYDNNNNPFLFIANGQTYVHSRIYVEIFYTEDIDVDEVTHYHGARVTTTPIYKSGTTWFDLRKNPNCPICNTAGPAYYYN